ncbi:hypothetical protein J6590_030930 [Homalodisca vitripennis]|nr:hypothetical protein J6590_030930 [Homalodisca vitripennis]
MNRELRISDVCDESVWSGDTRLLVHVQQILGGVQKDQEHGTFSDYLGCSGGEERQWNLYTSKSLLHSCSC